MSEKSKIKPPKYSELDWDGYCLTDTVNGIRYYRFGGEWHTFDNRNHNSKETPNEEGYNADL